LEEKKNFNALIFQIKGRKSLVKVFIALFNLIKFIFKCLQKFSQAFGAFF